MLRFVKIIIEWHDLQNSHIISSIYLKVVTLLMWRCINVTEELLLSMMYRLDEWPFGKSWEEWTTKWWQWFLSIPIDNHPAYDKTGRNGGVNQIDPNVWFLAGTTGGSADRTITIPASKALLLPIINVTTSYSENPILKTQEDMTSFVNAHMKSIAKKEASIDDEGLLVSEAHRVRSPCFEFSFPSNNIYGAKEGLTRGVGDGYWIFLKPLPAGMHNIKISGACMSGRIQIDLNLKLMVEKDG